MLQVIIESAELETRTKKGSTDIYQVQHAYVTTYSTEGKPKKYPEEVLIFPPRVNGKSEAYAPGNYLLAPQSLRVTRGFLELGSVVLLARKS